MSASSAGAWAIVFPGEKGGGQSDGDDPSAAASRASRPSTRRAGFGAEHPRRFRAERATSRVRSGAPAPLSGRARDELVSERSTHAAFRQSARRAGFGAEHPRRFLAVRVTSRVRSGAPAPLPGRARDERGSERSTRAAPRQSARRAGFGAEHPRRSPAERATSWFSERSTHAAFRQSAQRVGQRRAPPPKTALLA